MFRADAYVHYHPCAVWGQLTSTDPTPKTWIQAGVTNILTTAFKPLETGIGFGILQLDKRNL